MQIQPKVLIAISEDNDSTILAAYLEQRGYFPTTVRNGSKILDFFKSDNYDLCILDVDIDGVNGIDIAKEIRICDYEVPILFLSSCTDVFRKIAAFEAGADDYITSPYNMEELLCRVAAIMRRCYNEDNDETFFQIGKFTFDYTKQLLVFNNTVERRLTTKESELLRLFAINVGHVVERKTALQKIWRDSSFYNARSMDVYITKLRKYLAADSDVDIVNVHSVGFRLVVADNIKPLRKREPRKATRTKSTTTKKTTAKTTQKKA